MLGCKREFRDAWRDVEVLYLGQFTRGEFVQEGELKWLYGLVKRQSTMLKCSVFIVVLLSVGNS